LAHLFEYLQNDQIFINFAYLNLSNSNITDDFGSIIKTLIKESKYLVELNLSSN